MHRCLFLHVAIERLYPLTKSLRDDPTLWHYGVVKPRSGSVEGTQAFTRFTKAMRQILSVSKEELTRREEDYRKRSLANPNRRGPKKKAKTKD